MKFGKRLDDARVRVPLRRHADACMRYNELKEELKWRLPGCAAARAFAQPGCAQMGPLSQRGLPFADV